MAFDFTVLIEGLNLNYVWVLIVISLIHRGILSIYYLRHKKWEWVSNIPGNTIFGEQNKRGSLKKNADYLRYKLIGEDSYRVSP